jgi:VWFA-related protein
MCHTLSPRARRFSSFHVAALMVASASWSGGGPDAQQTDPRDRQVPTATFRVDINFVELPTVVVDRQGRFVGGLSETDFEVYEDGKRQTISTFRVVDLQMKHAEAPPTLEDTLEVDVETNAAPFDGRLYVLLIDDLHIDFVNTTPTQELARRFVDMQVGAGDLAAIVCTSGRTVASQDFTASRRLLLRAVDGCTGRAPDATAQGSSPLPGRENSGMFDARERDRNRRVTLSAIRAIADSLAAIRGRRKALVLFSEGFSLPDLVGEAQIEFADTISAANRANVSIYGVDPGGLKVAGGPETLRRLSLDTGGLVAINTNLLGAALDRIGQDNSRYYLLGYYPATTTRDGKFHRVDVKVGVPGVEVRARPGYVAPRANTTPSGREAVSSATRRSLPLAVQEALEHPLPVPGLGLTVFAAPFKGGAKAASVIVVVQVNGRDLRFKQSKGRFEGSLALAVLATDTEGQTENSLTRMIGLPLRAETYNEVVANGIRLVESLDLPRGRYRLRIAVQDMVSQRVGSVHYDLDVPDFGANPFAMSGLVLTSSRAGLVPNAPSEHLQTFRPYLTGPPTVARVFQPGEVLGLMAQVYDRDTGPHTVDVLVTVRNTAGLDVFRQEDHRSSVEAAANSGVHRYATIVPLSALAPGRYILAVEARSRVIPERLARRNVAFEIATLGR